MPDGWDGGDEGEEGEGDGQQAEFGDAEDLAFLRFSYSVDFSSIIGDLEGRSQRRRSPARNLLIIIVIRETAVSGFALAAEGTDGPGENESAAEFERGAEDFCPGDEGH